MQLTPTDKEHLDKLKARAFAVHDADLLFLVGYAVGLVYKLKDAGSIGVRAEFEPLQSDDGKPSVVQDVRQPTVDDLNNKKELMFGRIEEKAILVSTPPTKRPYTKRSTKWGNKK